MSAHYLHRLGGLSGHLRQEAADQIRAVHEPDRKEPIELATSSAQPFLFQKNRIDWRVLHGVNLHLLTKHQDVDALDRCINAGLAYGDLEAEDPSQLTLTNVLRVARLCQLAIQYFIATQDSLVAELAALQAAKDSADADRAKTTDRLHLLKEKHKQAWRKIEELDALAKQLKGIPQAASLLPSPGPVADEVPLPPNPESLSKADLKQALTEMYGYITQKVAEHQEEIDTLKAQLAEKDALLQAAQADKLAVLDRADTWKTQAAADREAGEADKQNLSALLRKLGVMERSSNSMKNEIARLRSMARPASDPGLQGTISRQQARLAELDADLGTTKKLYDEAAQRAKELDGEAGRLLAQLHELEARHNQAKDELARAQHERDLYKERCQDAKKVLSRLQPRVEQQEEELRRANQRCDALAKKLQEAQADYERELARLRRRLEDDSQLAAAKSGMDAAQQDILRARSALDTAIASRASLTL